MSYQSLRTLRQELTNIRLAAADTSMWSIIATVNQRARVAINDALRAYPFYDIALYTSLQIAESGQQVAIPPDIMRIHSIRATTTSTGMETIPSKWNHIPLGSTNLLEVYITKAPQTSHWLEIEYTQRVKPLPETVSLSADVNTLATTVQVGNPGALVQEWEPRGYLELSDAAETKFEVCYYASVDPEVGFHVVRGQMHTYPIGWAATDSVNVSPVVTMPPKAVSVMMAAAEANMYQFWLSHRALYDQYTALAGLQALDIAELLGMIRTVEDRADRRYARLRQAPQPGRVKVRVREDL